MTPMVWHFDETGDPVFDVNLSWPEATPDALPASRDDFGRIGEWATPHLPQDLTADQAEAIACYARYGHYFGRQVLLRNSYKKKDLIGRLIACAISGEDNLGAEVVTWSTHIFRRRLQNYDVREIEGFAEIYDWTAAIAAELTASGWPLRIEPVEEVRP